MTTRLPPLLSPLLPLLLPPDLGVQRYREGASTRLHALDEGNHGLPLHALLLPVVVSSAPTANLTTGQTPEAAAFGPIPARNVHLALHGQALPPPYSAAQLQAAHVLLAGVTTGFEGSYHLTVADSDWPTGGTDVLLLLVLEADARSNVSMGARSDGLTDSLARAVSDLLTTHHLASLRRGLLQQQSTAPAPTGAAPFCFVVTSCQYPHDVLDRTPLNQLAEVGPADATLMALEQALKAHRPGLLIHAGDQVYVDATAGYFDPSTRNGRYIRPFLLHRQTRGGAAVQRHLPPTVRSLIDDHELADNWALGDAAPPDLGSQAPGLQALGLQAYWEFQRLQPLRGHAVLDTPRWLQELHGGLPFFLADTRTEREPRTASNFTRQHIMRSQQWQALLQWLLLPAHQQSPKFVASPSIVLPRRLAVQHHAAAALHSDSWEAYPRSLHALLLFISQHQVQQVVFVSGDEHLSCLARADLVCRRTGRRTTVHSVHASAMYAPYPFANARVADFAGDESFELLDDEGQASGVDCHVHTQFAPPGDGFAVLHVTPPAAGLTSSSVSVSFYGAAGIKAGSPVQLPLT
jgi:PhoD-like phosphatase